MSPNDSDRVVVVGAGFGVWMDNRHVGSGRWGDVVEVRAVECDATHPDRVTLRMELRDGSDVSIRDDLNGFQSFLTVAESTLPGMPAQSVWLPPILADQRQALHVPGGTILFSRRTPGQRKDASAP